MTEPAVRIDREPPCLGASTRPPITAPVRSRSHD